MEQPNYYAVIPAKVRYDKNLNPLSKLLYGEISALCDKKGYCYARNKYFAELYSTTSRTITRLIAELVDNGYITSEIVYKEGTKEIEDRYLRICEAPIDKNDDTYRQICQEGIDTDVHTPIDTDVQENNINNNQYKNNKEKESKKKKFTPPTFEEVQNYVYENNLNVDARDFIDYFEATDWVDSKGQKVVSWKGKLRTWDNMHKNQPRGSPRKKPATFADLIEEEFGNDEKGNSGNNDGATNIVPEILCEYDIE